MQQRLGVTGGLLATFKDQVTGRLEGDTVITRPHRGVGCICGILLVDNHGHALHHIHDQLRRDHAVTQPVGDMLAGNPQRGAVFHQANVVDVRHLGATDTLHWLAYVIDCNVWAGDVNQDGEVTASDIFPLGIYYGDAGTARLNASDNWEAQPSTDWGDSWQEMYLQRMVNKKHADANGDGIINALDAQTVALNFGKTHYQHNNQSEMQLLNASDPTLALNLPQNTFTDGSTIDVPITLGNQAIPATGVYGYAFTVQYPQAMVTNATVTFDNSWMGDANNQ